MLKKTPLFESHLRQNAKIVPFAAWQMPLYYQSILSEVKAVRENVGVFDVSHMGRISIQGQDLIAFLDYISTNKVSDKPFGKALYSVICNENGKALDDLLIYLLDSQQAFIVVNASNRDKDLIHLKKMAAQFQVDIQDHFENEGILSLQGPHVDQVFNAPNLAPFEIAKLEDGLIISRTGYTGELGYEFYGPAGSIQTLWELLINKGAVPCGLGARDVLRQEMGYALYGHELSEEIFPLESVAKWAVKLDGHSFLGKKALEEAQKDHLLRYPIALIGQEGIPAREGYPIFYKAQEIGKITSGTFSPTIKKAIALGMVKIDLPVDVGLEVLIRSRYHLFDTVKLPFIRK